MRFELDCTAEGIKIIGTAFFDVGALGPKEFSIAALLPDSFDKNYVLECIKTLTIALKRAEKKYSAQHEMSKEGQGCPQLMPKSSTDSPKGF